MKIKTVIHDGLRRFAESDDASGLQPAAVSKIRRMVTFLQDRERKDELPTVPSWKAHLLTGERKGRRSLFVTNNWRMTFRIDQDAIEIIELGYEDYHQEVAMNDISGFRMKNPAHPGGFIKHEIIEPLGLTVTAAAQVLGVTRASLSTRLNERA